MGGNRRIASTGQNKRVIGTLARRKKVTVRRDRCEYCFGWVNDGEDRKILVDGDTRYVHARHPKREGEQPAPPEEGS